ncbi:MAG: M67 family metallopeptidase [Terracidiphilus sp.]|jgi:proteasome lid subunit RPN8/RPN11
MALKMSRSLYDRLRRHGEKTYPHECCGVLLGEFDEAGEKVARNIVQCGSTRTDSPANRYHISPSDLVRIQREALLAGHDIVGFYHSHPDHPARWSATDLAEAHWTGCSYVITSVEEGRAALTNAYLLVGEEDGKHFDDEVYEVSAE